MVVNLVSPWRTSAGFLMQPRLEGIIASSVVGAPDFIGKNWTRTFQSSRSCWELAIGLDLQGRHRNSPAFLSRKDEDHEGALR